MVSIKSVANQLWWLLVWWLLPISCEWSQKVTDFECEWSSRTALFANLVNSSKEGYWWNGVWTLSTNYDNVWEFKYCRPKDTTYFGDYSTLSTQIYNLNTTAIANHFNRHCQTNSNPFSAMYSFDSTRHQTSAVAYDRLFYPKCVKLPAQFSRLSCVKSPEAMWHVTSSFECDGALTGIDSCYHPSIRGARTYWFTCCGMQYTPMKLSQTKNSGYLLHGITSVYDTANASRSNVGVYVKPNWFDGNVVSSAYPLANSRSDVFISVRLCPEHAAFTDVPVKNADSSWSVECGELNNKVITSDGVWTEYMSDFNKDFSLTCTDATGIEGVIGGMMAHFGPSANGWKYKFYCLKLALQTYTPSKMKIKVTTHDVSGSESGANDIFTLTLCWDNTIYQSIVTLDALDTEFAAKDIRAYGTCGNQRELIISTDSPNTDTITQISVTVHDVEYVLYSFDAYETTNAVNSTRKTAISMSTSVNRDVVFKYPDNYLLACPSTSSNGGCIGSVYPMHDSYLVTITKCDAYNLTAGTPKIGIVIRGLNGNLDKKVLTGPIFKELNAGSGDVGKILDIVLEHDGGPDFCIQKLEIMDGKGTKHEFGGNFFGDGVIISGDCAGDGSFRRLTGIQYVPCHTKVYTIQTFQTSLYTSIQIHTCESTDGDMLAEASGLLSLTITGKSKNKKFVNSEALSLQSATDWASGTSRDYTLPLFGEYQNLALVTITNNDETRLCIDNVLINGEAGFLASYYVGASADRTIAAVLKWPICKVEQTVTIKGSTKLPTNPESAATATCVNRNRLLSVSCSIEQTIETYEEIQWEQETGSEITSSFTMEVGTTTSTTLSETFSSDTTFGLEVNMKSDASEIIVGFEQTFGYDRNWGSSTDKSSSSAVTNEATSISVTTDGKVNGKSIAVACEGSIEVPPSQQVGYTLLVDKQAVKLETLTDLKMTKCSKYLPGLSEEDPNHYIFIYGIKGILKAKTSTNCYIAFNQATQVSPDPKTIDCGKERALATREWGTFVPQCDHNDTTKYKKCQCAYGDKWTEPTCGCVDETTGNLLDTEKSAVVAESETFKWTNWCTDHCGSGSFSLNAAAMAPPINLPEIENEAEPERREPQLEWRKPKPERREPRLEWRKPELEWPNAPEMSDKVKDDDYNWLMTIGVVGTMLALCGMMMVYLMNSINSWRNNYNGHSFKALAFDDTEANNI